MKKDSAGTINSIQVLRAFAALAVVYYHIALLQLGKDLYLPETGSWGVDVFFIISGFIIGMVITQNTTLFLPRRIIRVVPLYWIATFAWAGLVLALPGKANSTEVTFTGLLKSLFFIPFEMPQRVGPILGLGWTLNYEMFFYLLVAISLFLFKDTRKALALTLSVLLLLVASSTVYVPTNFALLHYQNPLLLEFVAGIFLYFGYSWYQKRDWTKAATLVSICFGIILFTSGTYLLVAQETGQIGYLFSGRVGFFGIPAFLVVTGTLLLEPLFKPSKLTRLLVEVGAGSYAIYLFHPFLVGLLGPSFLKNSQLPQNYLLGIGIVCSAIVLSAVLGVVIHRYVDTPIQRFCKRLVYKR